jgi:hypothetical protein
MSDLWHPANADGLSSQAMEPQASPPEASIPDAWRSTENDPPPHGKPVLLCWWHELFNEWSYEVAPYSTGKRYDNGYSSVSYHGSATHWVDIPEPPAKAMETRKGQDMQWLGAEHDSAARRVCPQGDSHDRP